MLGEVNPSGADGTGDTIPNPGSVRLWKSPLKGAARHEGGLIDMNIDLDLLYCDSTSCNNRRSHWKPRKACFLYSYILSFSGIPRLFIYNTTRCHTSTRLNIPV